MDLTEVGYDARDWINLAQDKDRWRAYVRAEMNLLVPEKPCVIVWLNATSLGGSGSELAARPVGFYFPPMTDSEEDLLPLRSFTCFKKCADIPPEPRRLAVASFRLNTEHDILGKHLNRFSILPSASCILCHQQEDMDRQHLAKCPALKSSKEVDRYWEARARIRRRIFCGPLEKELRKRLVKCFVWSVELYGERTWTLQRNEGKRIEAFEMWMWRRTVRVKWTDRIRNKIVFEKVSEERMMLKLIRKRKRNWLGLWLKRIIDDIRIRGSYAETKRKAENRKDWRLLGLQ
ncbi:hypothetical protein ANN_06273 [Periplaneta americana]|uniref:Reverse transcriptase zinc-binding domain-containing protein n=1 Tax=Periplaneta americana TaxID=6978 RepID=A0ABQ8TEP8_PERAM|nr:hypothetical protein ANN_06273 [Periplaneta americana]